MSTIDTIRKINKKIVHDNGTIDSFERQLINLNYGLFDMDYPMIISSNSECLKYVSNLNTEKPLIINPLKVLRIKTNHNLDLPFIMDCYDLLKNSLFSIDSLTKETSKVIVLDKYEEETGQPIIAVCRYDAKRGEVKVNQITSYYGKEKFGRLLINSWEQGKRFDKNIYLNQSEYNKKIEQLIKYTRLQLPNYLIYALSTSYFRQTFTKSQVEQDVEQDVRDGLQVERCVDENEDYRLIRCANGSFEIRDYDDELVAETKYDNLEEALEELQNENDLQI